jgi:recombination protein RecA
MDNDSKTRRAALMQALKKINGDDPCATILSDTDEVVPEWIPIESVGFSRMIGGGLPKGKLIEVAGKFSSGKSSICHWLAGSVQKNGGTVALFDMEKSFNSEHAKVMGLNTDNLVLLTPEVGETALDAVNSLIESGAVDLIIIDSIDALVSKKEFDEKMEKDSMALRARLVGKWARRAVQLMARTGTTILAINQLRDSMSMYGPKTTTSGGHALEFYSSVRVETSKREDIKDGQEKVGIRVSVKNSKNKCSVPYRSYETELLFRGGFNPTMELIDAAEADGIITRNGPTYSFRGEKIAVGREKTIEALKENRELYVAVYDEEMALVRSGGLPVGTPEPIEGDGEETEVEA